MIAWAWREGTEGYGRGLKVSGHPYTINGRIAHPSPSLEGNWWEEGRVSGEDGFMEAKASAEG